MTARTPWADRALASAIGIALACVLFFGLAGCGDSSSPPEPLATATSSTQGGHPSVGAAVLVLPLLGPVVTVQQPTTVRVQLLGQVLQGAHYAAHGTLSTELTPPYPSGVSSMAQALPAGASALRVDYSTRLLLPAGSTQLMGRLTVRASDVQGLSTSALGRAEATVHWIVELP